MLLSAQFAATLLFLLVFSATGCFAFDGPRNGTDDNPVVATVNGRPIHLAQIKPSVEAALAKYRKYGASSVSEETRKQVIREEVDRQIAFEVLAQAGESTRGREQGGGAGSSTGDATAVSLPTSDAAGEKLDQSRQVIRKMLVDEYLARRGVKELRVPEEQLRSYYEANRKSFKIPASVRVSHILIRVPTKANPAEVEAARRKIGDIREEALRGTPFTELARQHSACASAKEGGDLGYVSPGYMPMSFEKAAFALKAGEISHVVTTRHGFHIIKAFDRKAERMQEFGEVREFVEKLFVKKLQAQKIDEIVTELKRTAKVEVKLP